MLIVIKRILSFEAFIIAMFVIITITIGFGLAGKQPPLMELASSMPKR